MKKTTSSHKFTSIGILLTVLLLVVLTLSCSTSKFESETKTSIDTIPELPSNSYILPTEDGTLTIADSHSGDLPSGKGIVEIDGIGKFTFEVGQIETLRPDIFRPGHFSLFDAISQLHHQGDIELEYHFDKSMDTNVIDTINGQDGWWYIAKYSSGWYEDNVFRMDMYPYKNGTETRIIRIDQGRLEKIYGTFREEVLRLEVNNGKVILPEATIMSPKANLAFKDVVVTAHSLRSDVLQPGVITALDILLSLVEQGQIDQLKLTWYEQIGSADPVDNYFMEQINEAVAYDTCGFVYETGPREFPGFAGSHIHIPSDVRVILSPEYALWFWLCL